MSKVAIVVEDNGNTTTACKHLLSHIIEEIGLTMDECVLFRVSSKVMRYGKPESLYTYYKKDNRVPSEQLQHDFEYARQWVDRQQPSVIIACGDVALDCFLGEVGVSKIRGSEFEVEVHGQRYPLLATYSPAMVIKRWDWRAIMKRDFRRALKLRDFGYQYPNYSFIIAPTYDQASMCLAEILLEAENSPHEIPISCDIETIARQTACVGFGWSETEAICIPLMSGNSAEGFYTYEEELELTKMMIEILRHPNIIIIGQNFTYDAQYFCRYWGCMPTNVWDTMTAQHTCFPGMPKALDFISSMYCEFHTYWKDELKDYKRYPEDETTFWIYNCKDCAITWEAFKHLKRVVRELGLEEQNDFQQKLFYPILKMMLRGVKQDMKLRQSMNMQLMDAIYEREVYLYDVVGYALNPKSPKQMQTFFYEELGLKPQKKRTPQGMRISTDSEALKKLAALEPIIAPIVQVIEEIRSLNIFLSNFVNAQLDRDHHIRCSYNISGTETFRFSSSKNVFGGGANLQTIPKGTEK